MTTVEVIAVLKMIAAECRAGSIDKHSNLKQYADAVEEALALAKVGEHLKAHPYPTTLYFRKYEQDYVLDGGSWKDKHSAPTITELAAKLEKLP